MNAGINSKMIHWIIFHVYGNGRQFFMSLNSYSVLHNSKPCKEERLLSVYSGCVFLPWDFLLCIFICAPYKSVANENRIL